MRIKQVKMGQWWGMAKNIGVQIASYMTPFTFVFTAITLYTTTIVPFFRDRGINIPFWAFGMVLVVGVGAMALFEYSLSMPSYYAFWNHQIYKHDNPLVGDIKKLQCDIDKIKKHLGVE